MWTHCIQMNINFLFMTSSCVLSTDSMYQIYILLEETGKKGKKLQIPAFGHGIEIQFEYQLIFFSMTFALAILQCESFFSITMGNERKRIEEFLGRCILLDRFCRRTLPCKTNTSREKKAWGICHAY